MTSNDHVRDTLMVQYTVRTKSDPAQNLVQHHYRKDKGDQQFTREIVYYSTNAKGTNIVLDAIQMPKQ